MDIQQYISSGIIENYVLGATSPQENAEVERLAEQYPEIQLEIEASKFALTEYIMQFQQKPPLELKHKVLHKLSELEEEESLPDKARATVAWIPYWLKREINIQPYWVAASITLLISLAANIFLYFKWLETKQELFIAQTENTILADDLNQYKNTQDILMDRSNRLAELKGSEKFPQGRVAVFWNYRTQEVYLQVKDLPHPPPGKQYQLWSVHEGIVLDAGMIEMDKALSDIQKMKDVNQVDAFVITLEKEGGVEVAEGDIYAQGQLSRIEENS